MITHISPIRKTVLYAVNNCTAVSSSWWVWHYCVWIELTLISYKVYYGPSIKEYASMTLSVTVVMLGSIFCIKSDTGHELTVQVFITAGSWGFVSPKAAQQSVVGSEVFSMHVVIQIYGHSLTLHFPLFPSPVWCSSISLGTASVSSASCCSISPQVEQRHCWELLLWRCCDRTVKNSFTRSKFKRCILDKYCKCRWT